MFITGLNQLTIRLGYFLVKSVGKLFQRRRDIVMVGQENLNLYNLHIEKRANLKLFISYKLY